MAINLSEIKTSEIVSDLGSMNVLIYGPPKVGKSTLASHIPNSLFLATERGHSFLQIKKVDITDWTQVIELGAALSTQPDHGFKTLVIDIVDYLYKLCERHVMTKHKVEHPSDLAFGKGFSLVKDEFNRVVTKLNMLGFGMVFISHAKEKTFKTKAQEWTMMGTSMGGSPEAVISGMCDLILYCYPDEVNNRMMRTKPTKYILSGDRSKKLPEIMPMDYKLLLQYLNGTMKSDGKLSDKAKEYQAETNGAVTTDFVKLKNYAPGAEA